NKPTTVSVLNWNNPSTHSSSLFSFKHGRVSMRRSLPRYSVQVLTLPIEIYVSARRSALLCIRCAERQISGTTSHVKCPRRSKHLTIAHAEWVLASDAVECAQRWLESPSCQF